MKVWDRMNRFTDLSHGYFPNDIPNTMYYNDWKSTIGKYRWYRENGDARVLFDLDYHWKKIYDRITEHTDIAFSYRIINDVVSFTNEFLNRVPLSWLKFKTQLELLTGELTGDTINPDVFSAGFTRETDSRLDNTFNNSSTGKSKTDSFTRNDETVHSDGSSKIDGNIITDDVNKSRQLLYNQGVQAYPNISNDNIGELGIDYAGNMQDNIVKNHSNNDSHSTQIDVNNGTNNALIEQNGNIDENVINSGVDNDIFHEIIKESRINFYDNLAFLRTRVELMDKIQSFELMFEDLFINVSVFNGWWN